LELIVGAQRGVPFFVAGGLTAIIGGAVTGTGGMLLLTYAARLGSLAFGDSPKALESAMDRLKTFWVFVSIVGQPRRSCRMPTWASVLFQGSHYGCPAPGKSTTVSPAGHWP
jgi:hypothetical protein